MTIDQLAELEAKATKGPWKASHPDTGHGEVTCNEPRNHWVFDGCTQQRDIDFIAALRNHAAALIAVARAAKVFLDVFDNAPDEMSRAELAAALAALEAP